MRYCFSGHESFPCKSMWLKKGYDYLVDRNRFTDPDAVVKLGVGKNMVQSIRFWLRAFGLLNDDEATEIAHYLFDDRDGRDPYAEDNATLWILHYMLVVTAVSSIYRLFFVDLQREKKEFDKEQVLSFIKRKCNVPEQKNVFNENTVKKDIYNPQIQISAESETKRSIFREKDKTKRSKKESAQHSKSRNKSFVMTSVSAL